ncbi:regulator of nonsense transcripts 1-like [Branchiostoma floridae x Branchiostoma japonicum]
MTFSRVLVDEAAQATEPAVLCALSHGCQQVCLIGDDQQLPPLVQSEDAQELKISLFERWRGQKLRVHLLDTQYRMHPAISAFPSQHFYNGQIKDGIEASDRPLPAGFNWPNQNMPVSFVNVSSRETSRGTSKFNDEEVKIVIAVTKRLLEGGDIREDDIGIVSPYKAQIKKITEGLDRNISVRSVDGFQGQERDVIIFSAVRANEGGYVGFLNDPRRMNVLLTRAKRGLLVVGDGKTLEKGSDDWNKWIQWVRENKLEQLRAEGTGTGLGRQAGTNSAQGHRQRGRGYRGRGAGRARRGRGHGWYQSKS